MEKQLYVIKVRIGEAGKAARDGLLHGKGEAREYRVEASSYGDAIDSLHDLIDLDDCRYEVDEVNVEAVSPAKAIKPSKGWEFAGALALAVGLLAGPSWASSACLEADKEHVRIVDAEGKKHRFTLFIIGEEDEAEYAQFLKGRKVAAMDPDRALHLKTVDGVDTLRNVADCPASKRSKLKM